MYVFLHKGVFLFHSYIYGKAVVRCQLLTKAAWVQCHVSVCQICGGCSCTGGGFLWIVWFPLPVLIQQNSHLLTCHLGWYSGPLTAQVPKAPVLPHLKIKKYIYIYKCKGNISMHTCCMQLQAILQTLLLDSRSGQFCRYVDWWPALVCWVQECSCLHSVLLITS